MHFGFFYKKGLLSTLQSAIVEAPTVFSRLPSLMADDKPCPLLQPSLRGAEFGRSVNPILIRGGGQIDYAHHTTTCPFSLGFSDLPMGLVSCITWCLLHIFSRSKFFAWIVITNTLEMLLHMGPLWENWWKNANNFSPKRGFGNAHSQPSNFTIMDSSVEKNYVCDCIFW